LGFRWDRAWKRSVLSCGSGWSYGGNAWTRDCTAHSSWHTHRVWRLGTICPDRQNTGWYIQYTHDVIVHQQNFVDPGDEDVHTQNVENMWMRAKRKLRRQFGTSRELFPSCINWFWYLAGQHVEETLDCLRGIGCLRLCLFRIKTVASWSVTIQPFRCMPGASCFTEAAPVCGVLCF